MVPGGAVRAGKYKLIEWYEPKLLNQEKSIELFDLENDQGGTVDLSETNPEKAAELQKMLDDWRTEVGAQMPTVNDRQDIVSIR